MQIQNQSGNKPRKWYATGVVVECLPNRQYRVLIDGSRRVTLRNRKFLKRIDPACRKRVSVEPDTILPVSAEAPPNAVQGTPEERRATTPSIESKVATPQRPRAATRLLPRRIADESESSDQPSVPHQPSCSQSIDDVQQTPREGAKDNDSPLPRRGERNRKPKVPFSPKISGKTHN